MDCWMDTVCLCRDPLLSTHSGWVKAFGFFHWKSKSCSASGEWGIGFPSPGILRNMVFEKAQLLPLYLSPLIFFIWLLLEMLETTRTTGFPRSKLLIGNGISSSDMSRAHHGFGVVIKVLA
ncbi:unnamed protein product [Musa banksii]